MSYLRVFPVEIKVVVGKNVPIAVDVVESHRDGLQHVGCWSINVVGVIRRQRDQPGHVDLRAARGRLRSV